MFAKNAFGDPDTAQHRGRVCSIRSHFQNGTMRKDSTPLRIVFEFDSLNLFTANIPDSVVPGKSTVGKCMVGFDQARDALISDVPSRKLLRDR